MKHFNEILKALTDMTEEEEQGLAVGLMIGMSFASTTKREEKEEEPEDIPYRRPMLIGGSKLEFHFSDRETMNQCIMQFLNLFARKEKWEYIPVKKLFDILDLSCIPHKYDGRWDGWKEMSFSDIKINPFEGGWRVIFPEPSHFGLTRSAGKDKDAE